MMEKQSRILIMIWMLNFIQIVHIKFLTKMNILNMRRKMNYPDDVMDIVEAQLEKLIAEMEQRERTF